MKTSVYRLQDVLINYDYLRKPLSSMERENFKGEYPYYGAQGIIDYVQTYRCDGEYLLIAEDGENLMSRSQPLALIANGRFWVNNHAHIVKTNGLADLRYVCYSLNHLDITGYITGSAQPKLSQTNLNKIKMAFPPLEYQIRIVSILSSYDNLIEVNNKRIKMLEQMAENLYKEWFVRFRFPGHETAEFENGIPKGWRIKKLGELCSIITGKKDANEATGDGKYPFFTCARETSLSTNDYILDKDAILISGNGSYTGFVKKYSGKFDLYQRTYALFDFVNIEWLFLYWTLKIEFEREYMGGSRGSAIPYITKPNIEKFKIMVPTIELQKQSQRFFEIMHNECIMLELEKENLAKQRDLVLPRLMSGKLEV